MWLQKRFLELLSKKNKNKDIKTENGDAVNEEELDMFSEDNLNKIDTDKKE